MLPRHRRMMVVCFALVCCSSLGLARRAAAQAGFVSGGLVYDIKRYSSGVGPQTYDGEAIGGYVGVGAFITRRFSAEFEMALSGDATNRVSFPILINASTNTISNITSIYETRLQTYSALFGVHTAPSRRLHLSYRGGVTFIHHRRRITPPLVLPADPAANTVGIQVTLIDNVAAPTAGVDADFLLAPRLALVAALRVHAFSIENDLSAFSIRPMVGARVSF